jgi:hypothetical protein
VTSDYDYVRTRQFFLAFGVVLAVASMALLGPFPMESQTLLALAILGATLVLVNALLLAFG